MEYMNAAVCSKYGSAEVLSIQKIQKPLPKDDEVLVQVFASSVTNSDIFIRSSKVSPAFIIPFRLAIGVTKPRNKIIGQVFAGKIVETGKNVTRFSIGDKVFGLTGFSLGAYAEYKSIKEINSKRGCIARMPSNISFEDATYAAYGGLLALQFIEKVTINNNDKILLYGAASTSGTFALQYLKSLGAKVTCVCRTDKHAFISSLGADALLDYTDENSVNMLEEYKVFIDCVGKAKTSKLREESEKHIVDKRNKLSIDDEALLLDSRRLEKIADLVENDKIKPINDRIYLLSEIVEAHKYVELGHKTGNVAIKIRAET